jgi:flavin reductase (DIM6/NTAB) family NADH-FMN oxidoreductase RutF
MDANIRRKVLRLISNGLFVLTSRFGDHYGAATVTWLSQASFKPPFIMAAVRPGSSVFACLKESRVAAVHILGSAQQEIAKKFIAATLVESGYINGEPFRDGKTLSPILTNAPAYVECNVKHIHEDGGDHAIVVMEVVEAVLRTDVRPLTVEESPWEYGG